MTLAVGLVGEASTVVDAAHLASAVGSGGIDVFSTPSLVALMEGAAVRAVQDHLPAGQTSVGTRIDIRHLAATPGGEPVTARAELKEIDGRRLIFQVEAHDRTEKVGEGTHERMLVDPQRLIDRAKAKQSPAPST